MTEKKPKAKTPKARILYYQFRAGKTEANWIYQLMNDIHVSEVRRIPFEEGLIIFLRNSGGKLLSSDINIHDFAAHLSSSYRKKNKLD